MFTMYLSSEDCDKVSDISSQGDIQFECIEDMLATACELLDDLNCASFHVSGFGQNIWPVDVRTDLAIVLEQVTVIRKQLSETPCMFSLDFYEQGVEREVSFFCESDYVIIRCKSRTNWKPSRIEEKTTLDEVRKTFDDLYHNFCKIVQGNLPDLANNNHFKTFCQIVKN